MNLGIKVCELAPTHNFITMNLDASLVEFKSQLFSLFKASSTYHHGPVDPNTGRHSLLLPGNVKTFDQR